MYRFCASALYVLFFPVSIIKPSFFYIIVYKK
nr:MAG TPA: hypothetical protein [Caudoviricetes sp.]